MIKKLIPHICIVLSLMMLTFFTVDLYNPGMNFVGNHMFKILLAIYGIVALITSVFLVLTNLKNKGE